jgi:hypothetical protein
MSGMPPGARPQGQQSTRQAHEISEKIFSTACFLENRGIMNQPFIIEAKHSNGDNEISFSIRGSVEWGKQHSQFIETNILHLFTTQIKTSVESEDYKDLIKAITALQKKQNFTGENVSVKCNQEAE